MQPRPFNINEQKLMFDNGKNTTIVNFDVTQIEIGNYYEFAGNDNKIVFGKLIDKKQEDKKQEDKKQEDKKQEDKKQEDETSYTLSFIIFDTEKKDLPLKIFKYTIPYTIPEKIKEYNETNLNHSGDKIKKNTMFTELTEDEYNKKARIKQSPQTGGNKRKKTRKTKKSKHTKSRKTKQRR
jgi:hypothetical protein